MRTRLRATVLTASALVAGLMTACGAPSTPSGQSGGTDPGQVPDKPAKPVTLDGITDREQEVLLLIARGRSNAEIAVHLHVGMATVKTHIARTLTKLDARDRAQLIVIAYESRLVRPGEA